MITQYVRVLKSIITNIQFSTESIFSGLELYQYTTPPAWVTIYTGGTGIITFISTLPTTNGTYTLDFTLNTSPPLPSHRLVIEVVNSLTTPTDLGCSNENSINIVWLNREGGTSNFIFNERKDFGTVIEKGSLYYSNKTTKHLRRGDIYKTKRVYKTGLTNEQTDLVESLIYSIQAWEYDEVNDTFTPILIDVPNFSKYNTKEKLNELSFEYKIANYLTVQSQ